MGGWVVVGLLGQILVRDNDTCIEGGHCKVGDGGIAVKSDRGYPVLKRVGDGQILIMFNSIASYVHVDYLYKAVNLNNKELNELKHRLEQANKDLKIEKERVSKMEEQQKVHGEQLSQIYQILLSKKG